MAAWFGIGLASFITSAVMLVALMQIPAGVGWPLTIASFCGAGVVHGFGYGILSRRPCAVPVGLGAFAASLGAWIFEIACTMAALAAFHLQHTASHAMAVLFGVNLALAMPAPPANLGNFELGAGVALVGLGADRDQVRIELMDRVEGLLAKPLHSVSMKLDARSRQSAPISATG